MRRPWWEGDREGGMSALEVVLLAPLVIGFVLVLVGFGVLVDARGTVQGAARDAARMGSLQRDYVSANAAARNTAFTDLGNTCNAGTSGARKVDPVTTSADFGPGQFYTIRVTCTVSLSGLNWFPLTETIVSYSTAPLDTFRRTN
jgi:Flp pilus assembly protein TadG